MAHRCWSARGGRGVLRFILQYRPRVVCSLHCTAVLVLVPALPTRPQRATGRCVSRRGFFDFEHRCKLAPSIAEVHVHLYLQARRGSAHCVAQSDAQCATVHSCKPPPRWAVALGAARARGLHHLSQLLAARF